MTADTFQDARSLAAFEPQRRRSLLLAVDELEFQVNDRRSFEEFVGLGVRNSIPDATTVAFFRERLRKAGVIKKLFELFEGYLRSQGLQARSSQIIDATLVPVPKQRTTREVNKEIKAGRLPERAGMKTQTACSKRI